MPYSPAERALSLLAPSNRVVVIELPAEQLKF